MITDAAFRARMRTSYRFDHAYLLDERDALKSAIESYIVAMNKGDAFEHNLAEEDIPQAVAEIIACIDNCRATTPREDVADWFAQ